MFFSNSWPENVFPSQVFFVYPQSTTTCPEVLMGEQLPASYLPQPAASARGTLNSVNHNNGDMGLSLLGSWKCTLLKRAPLF